MTTIGNEDIGGFDVSVENVFPVRCIKAVCNLDRDLEELAEGEGSAGYLAVKTLALQKLHGDEMPSLVVADFEYGANAGVAEGGCRPRFARQAIECLGILLQVLRKKLQSHMAAQLEIFRCVHHAHAPATQQTEDSVMGYALTDHRCTLSHNISAVRGF